jgi:hypothetical protein
LNDVQYLNAEHSTSPLNLHERCLALLLLERIAEAYDLEWAVALCRAVVILPALSDLWTSLKFLEIVAPVVTDS